MSYIGNQPLYQAFVTDQFNGDGSTVAFTMSVAPANTASVLVSVTGVLQDPSTYAVAGTTLTFSAAPPSGTGNISVRYLGIPAAGVTNTAYRTVTEFTATSGQTSFTVPSYTVGFINVYRNGVRLGAADFTATTGTTVVLASGATTGDLITTESFYVSSVLNAIPATAGAVNSTYITDGAVTRAKMGYAGAVLQVVQSTYSTFQANSSSAITDTGLQASITPTSATSKILVCANICGVYTGVSSCYARFLFDRDGTSLINFGTASGYGTASGVGGSDSGMYLDSPATSSSVTYKVRWSREGGGSVNMNNTASTAPTAGTSTLTLMEIAQ